MFAPLRRRLVLVNAAIIAAVVVALAAAILLSIDRVLLDQQAGELQETSRGLLARLADTGDDGERLPALLEEGGFYVLWNASGTVAANPAGVATAPLQAAAQDALHGTTSTRTIRLGSDETLVASSPVQSGGAGATRGALQVGRSLRTVRGVEAGLVALVLGAGGVGLLLSLLGGWLLAERSLVPIRRAFRRQQEFAADASHEMRTPLAVVDAGLQMLRRHPERTVGESRETLDSMSAQVTRMEALVDALLTLARADAGAAELALEPADVDALVRETVDPLGELARSRGASLGTGRLAAGRAVVDPERIRQLVTILVENALVHGGEGVAVEVSAARDRGSVVLEIADDGPGIPADERRRVLERFVRGESAVDKPGTGLGLAIAEWIAAAHGGRIELLDGVPASAAAGSDAAGAGGRGFRVRVSLPARGSDG